MARTYTTIQGDMWDGIAKKMLGSEYYMTQLLEVNPEYLHIVVFPAGIELTIPDIEETTYVESPPWLAEGE